MITINDRGVTGQAITISDYATTTGYVTVATAVNSLDTRLEDTDRAIKDLQDALADLLLLSDYDQGITNSVYSMVYEEYAMLSYKL